MAYLDFTLDTAPVTPTAPSPRHDPVPATLGALEWSVVALARRDTLASLGTPGRIAVALGRVFGGRRTSPRLADPRLEALRRMAVLSWHHGYVVPTHEVEAFLAAGFTNDQYDRMLASIGIARARTRHA